MLKTYFQDLFNTTKTGDATEESYYPDLKRLIENWGKQKGKKFYITPLPKRTEAGNPDFRIWDGKSKIVGYIEAKAPNIENLDVIQGTDQLKRYLHTFPNLLLTNFFEFRLYRHGQLVNTVQIGRPFIIHKLKMAPPVENQERGHILSNFYAFELMMAPYAVGHLKIGFVLEELGYKLSRDERFKLYLTNTLEAEDLVKSPIPGLVSLSEESSLAGKVKREIPILVIYGNPPYSSAKAEGTEFINELMFDYLTGLGVEQEKKKGTLQDEYIRFIRFAHWKIDQVGQRVGAESS